MSGSIKVSYSAVVKHKVCGCREFLMRYHVLQVRANEELLTRYSGNEKDGGSRIERIWIMMSVVAGVGGTIVKSSSQLKKGTKEEINRNRID
jgi:hypothetical protein